MLILRIREEGYLGACSLVNTSVTICEPQCAVSQSESLRHISKDQTEYDECWRP